MANEDRSVILGIQPQTSVLNFMSPLPQKAVCVARNYRAHAQELGNPIPDEPVFFLKPPSAICPLEEPLVLPSWSNSVHHEIELAVLVKNRLSNASLEEVRAGLGPVAVALDLTARDIQQKLKEKGLPWEKAKAFARALPLGPWIEGLALDQPITLELKINGQTRQKGNTSQMIHSIFALAQEASRYFTLEPGDLLLTGTPEGVGPLAPGDQLELILADRWRYLTQVAHGR